MANPYQQGGYAPQYYVPTGAIYPGAYYATPQGYVAAAPGTAGQQYGQIYAMPTTMPYAVPQQPAVAAPQVRALANPLDAMFGTKPAAAAPAPSTAPKPQTAHGNDSWMSTPITASAAPTSAIAAYASPSALFSSFASAPTPVASQPVHQLPPSATVMAPMSVMTPALGAPKALAYAPAVSDDGFGSFVSATHPSQPKPPAPVSASFTSSISNAPYHSTPFVASLPSVAPKTAPVPVSTTSFAAPPYAASKPAPVTTFAAPLPIVAPAASVRAPVQIHVAPTAIAPVVIAPSHSPSAPTAISAAPASAKASKKAIDWNNVNYANVFADIEQENAMAAQFIPVTTAPASAMPHSHPPQTGVSASAVAAAVQQQADDWGSFQASPVQPPTATQKAAPAMPLTRFAATPAPAPAPALAQLQQRQTVGNIPSEWGPMFDAKASPQSHPPSTSLSASASAPLHSSMPSFPAGPLPASAAQTASALFSSFSGFPASSPLAGLSAAPAGVVRSTGFANGITSVTPTLANTGVATAAIEFMEFTSFTSASPASSQPALTPTVGTLPASSAINSLSSFTSSVLKPSPPIAKQPTTAGDDFGEFSSAAPVVSKMPSTAVPHTYPSSPATSSILSSASSFASSANSSFTSAVDNFSSVTASAPVISSVDFGDFAAPLSTSPATAARLATAVAPSLSSTASFATSSVFSSASNSAYVASAAPMMGMSNGLSATRSVSHAVSRNIGLTPALPPSTGVNTNSVDFSDFRAPVSPRSATSLPTGAVSSFTSLAAPQLSPRDGASMAADEWGSFETAKPAAQAVAPSAYVPSFPIPLASAPVKAEAPRVPPMSAEALLGRAMKALDARSEDDFGSFSSPAPPPVVPTAQPPAGGSAGTGFGFLFAGPPLASALEASPGSPMIAVSRPQKPASDALPDVLVFLQLHERFDEALACRVHMAAQDKRSMATDAQVQKWRIVAPPAGHLTMSEMRKKLTDELGVKIAEKYANQFVDFSALVDLDEAATRHKQAQAFMKRLLATKGADLSDTRRAALQAIAAELAAAQEFASLVLLKSSIAGSEEEAVKKGVWSSAKGTSFFRALSELHVVYRRISHAIKEEGSDLTLSGLQASVSVAWNTLFATLTNEANRVEQDAPLSSAKDAPHVCRLCGLTGAVGAQTAFHTSCQNLQRHVTSSANRQ